MMQTRDQFTTSKSFDETVAATVRLLQGEGIRVDTIYISAAVDHNQVIVTAEQVCGEIQLALLGREGPAHRGALRALSVVGGVTVV